MAVNAGLYIHIPFCVKKCAYCDFYSITDFSMMDAFVDALALEMALSGDSPLTFDTLYLGGGTPSALTPQAIDNLISHAFSTFNIRTDTEITIEVNPGTVSLNNLRDYWQTGINRINLGVQSFSPAALQFLGRIHTAAQAESAIHSARKAGFENLGLDLIYGLPGQRPDAWQKDLEQAVGFSPEHLSCYSLTFEEETPLGKMKDDGLVEPLDDDTAADLFKLMQSILDRHGYEQYEIANFARTVTKEMIGNKVKSYRSQHNRKYWTSAPYIGLGPSAHSFVEPERRWNVADIQSYIYRLQQGVLPIEEIEILTDDQRLTESLYLGLRTVEGIDILQLEKKIKIDFYSRFGNVLADLAEEGLLTSTPARCALTPKGMRFLDGIVGILMGTETE